MRGTYGHHPYPRILHSRMGVEQPETSRSIEKRRYTDPDSKWLTQLRVRHDTQGNASRIGIGSISDIESRHGIGSTSLDVVRFKLDLLQIARAITNLLSWLLVRCDESATHYTDVRSITVCTMHVHVHTSRRNDEK